MNIFSMVMMDVTSPGLGSLVDYWHGMLGVSLPYIIYRPYGRMITVHE